MKTLYLLRHAKSSWSDPGLDDFERPLKGRGWRAAGLIGAWLRDHGRRPDMVLCSTAVRARQTLEVIDAELGGGLAVALDEALYMAAPATMLARLGQVDDGLSTVMMVGHNPGMEGLAAGLAGKFPTAALAVLRTEVAGWRDLAPGGARLEAFIRPRDLE